MTTATIPDDTRPDLPVAAAIRQAEARRAVRRLRGRLTRVESKVDRLKLWIQIAIALGCGQQMLAHHDAVKTALAALLG